jgi:hypothetical protein
MQVVVEGVATVDVDLALVVDTFSPICNTLESCAMQLTTSSYLKMARCAFSFAMTELSYNHLSFFLWYSICSKNSLC